MTQDSAVRMTTPTKLVVELFLGSRPGAEWHGTRIEAETKIGYGTLHKILTRLEGAGWLLSRWESEKVARGSGRPARRYYRMTAFGRKQAVERLGVD